MDNGVIIGLVILALPTVFLIVLACKNKKLEKELIELSLSNKKLASSYDELAQEKLKVETTLENLGYTEYSQVKKEIEKVNHEISDANSSLARLHENIENLDTQIIAKDKQLKTTLNKIAKNKEIIKAIDYAIENYINKDIDLKDCQIPALDQEYIDELLPSVILKLNAMNVADLRKINNENNKIINSLLEKYKERYTTKANRAIYSLMVIALRAELQNILIELKYEKLEKSIETVKAVTAKYLAMASEGNQSIASTLTKFIGELEYLFINAVQIEYNYYVKKEQAKQEQLLLREQIRQEAEERKALEAERKKIEKEEEKYHSEIDNVNERIKFAENDEEVEALKARLAKLEEQLSDVEHKKADIINLQNGKAGTVYIISNLGSFGEDVFKIGMTRRIEPMERVNELGDASVPFRFDVHSFIFSDDAVSLESNLHKIFNTRRMNKVNRRKEFFKVTIDEIEKIVLEIQPTAEFNKTMLAEEFKQSLSSIDVYSDELIIEDISEDD